MSDSVPAPAGEAPDVRAIRARLRCEITHHPCGTDTLMVRDGVPVWCCATCELHAALGASRAPGRDATPTKPWLEPHSLITKARDALVGTEYFLNDERHAAQRSHNRALVRDLNEYLGVSP